MKIILQSFNIQIVHKYLNQRKSNT